METRICRICGKLSQNHFNIFKTEGLKNKIETCLPIVVSPNFLLPDTICTECCETVDNFFNFVKNCLQNIIILEAQYDVNESCLKTKRKFDKGCYANLPAATRDETVQTVDYLDLMIGSAIDNFTFPLTSKFMKDFERKKNSLVDYDIETDNSDQEEGNSKVVLVERRDKMVDCYVETFLQSTCNVPKKNYFDDAENYIISEITHRKNLKRKPDVIETQPCTKICKLDSSSRRKSRQPKKYDLAVDVEEAVEVEDVCLLNGDDVVRKESLMQLPQTCLLCDSQFSGPAALTTHVFEVHGIDMKEIVRQNEAERQKTLPCLTREPDLKIEIDDNQPEEQPCEDPPTLLPSFVCPTCPAVFTTKADLFTHLRLKHSDTASLLCGLCLYHANTYANLKTHVEACVQNYHLSTRYICQICCYGDDSFKLLENHVLVHDFLLDACKKQSKMFDPADYITVNDSVNGTAAYKPLTCSECGATDFESFKEFSAHRRSQHSIFHCDLCNKFYGRNSHLWKHVNRLHKGHPSITCQMCYKTSASKYHLQQHFNKIHSQKPVKQKTNDFTNSTETEDFMSQKFQAFDFQSVKQSFMKQELLDQQKNGSDDLDDNSNNRLSDNEEDTKKIEEPKEIDSSSNLYTNIITNYTPPVNSGDYKCPKCGKGFQKKPLLKKHRKNCRPRLQKDLLTRCKSCARIFKDRQSLAKHLVNYHSEYVCEICDQKVQSKCEIVSHIRFTHPNCHLFCKICRNILRRHSDLLDHTKNHSDSYVCQFCGDALPSKVKLKMHILSLHRKILSLSCGICLKLFETQHILRRHVRLVHKELLTPLLSCTVCGKTYASKWKTFDHLNKSHGQIFTACRICLEVFNSEDQLNVHIESVHLNNGSRKEISKSDATKNADSGENCARNRDNAEETEESEEEENSCESNEDYVEETPIEEKPPVMSNDAKISLLEKRLIGKKITEEDTKKPVKNNVKNNKKTVKKPTENVETLHNSSNPLQNSSKRTVYVDSNDPSRCEICFKNWPAKKHLWQHYIRCHKTVAATVCGICLKTNDDYQSLQNHLLDVHPTLLHGRGFGSNFICRICGRYHNASSKLRLHMAIHENFDWSILPDVDKKPNSLPAKQETNGYKKEENNTGTINYEDDIEQVECSSQSEENDESDAEAVVKEESTSEEEEDEEDSCKSEDSLKQKMLKNMLLENRRAKEVSSCDDSNSTCTEENNGNVKSENETEDEEDEEDEDDRDEEDVSEDSTAAATSTSTANSIIAVGNIFGCKPEELDSAIKSISYGCTQEDEDVDSSLEDYCDMQQNNLNDNEIESAVGSIL